MPSPLAVNSSIYNEELAVSEISPYSVELVIAFVGFAGAGCSTAAKRMEVLLEDAGYEVHLIKLSSLIAKQFPEVDIQAIDHGTKAGSSRFMRACTLQDHGDKLRLDHGAHAVASLAIREIKRLRGPHRPGEKKCAYLLDSLKHLKRLIYSAGYMITLFGSLRYIANAQNVKCDLSGKLNRPRNTQV